MKVKRELYDKIRQTWIGQQQQITELFKEWYKTIDGPTERDDPVAFLKCALDFAAQDAALKASGEADAVVLNLAVRFDEACKAGGVEIDES